MRKFLAIALFAVCFLSVPLFAFAQVNNQANGVLGPNPTIVGNLDSTTTTGVVGNLAEGTGSKADIHIGSLIDGTVNGDTTTSVNTQNVQNSAGGLDTKATVSFGAIGGSR
ncbi:MAG: hypothetical protein ACE5FU_04430 [Nitrospinota bacterium]